MSNIKTFEEFIKESFRDEDLLTDEEMDYLHGKCHKWVLENYKPGDKIYLITCYDLEIQERALVHCGLYIDGKYVDVRGDEDDIDEVLDGFDYGPELDVEIIDIDEFKTYCKKNHLE